MKRLTFLAVVGTLVLLMPTAVWADLISVTGDISLQGIASVAPFDSTKGTLTGVSWSANAVPFVEVALKNNTSQDIHGVTLSFSGVNVSGTAPDGSASSASGGSGSIFYGIIPAGQFTDHLESVSMSLPSTSVDSSKLAFYEGPGQPSFAFSTPTYTLGTLPAGTSISSQSTGYVPPSQTPHGVLTVTYTYTPDSTTATPEPASLTLLGIAAVGCVGVTAWRKRRQALAATAIT